jgi:hypothetical protein
LSSLIASCQDSIAEVASIYDVIETVVTEFTMISNIKSDKPTDRFNRRTILRKRASAASVSFISSIAAKTCVIEAFAQGEFDTLSSRTKSRNTKIDAYLALPLFDRKADSMVWCVSSSTKLPIPGCSCSALSVCAAVECC